jgi:hypothetical protein
MFNKVYLKPDANFEKSLDSIIISPITSTLLPENSKDDVLLTQHFGLVHYQSDTFAALLSQFDNDETKFFNWLTNFDATKRLTIYVNDDDLLVILCKWYKALLHNISIDEAYKLFTLIYARFEYIFGLSYNPQVFITPDDAAKLTLLGKKLPTKLEFNQLWENTIPFDLSALTYNYFAEVGPLEFQIAAFYSASDYAYADAMKQKIVHMVSKLQMRYVIDLKQMVLQRLDVLPGYDITTQTLADWVLLNPRYKFLTDNNFLPDQYKFIADTYDLVDLRTVYEQLIVLIGYDYHHSTMDFMHFLDPDLTFDKVMDTELKAVTLRRQLGWWEGMTSINTYVLDYVLQLVRSQDVNTLRMWSVL